MGKPVRLYGSIAEEKGESLSLIVRQAVSEYLAKRAPSKSDALKKRLSG